MVPGAPRKVDAIIRARTDSLSIRTSPSIKDSDSYPGTPRSRRMGTNDGRILPTGAYKGESFIVGLTVATILTNSYIFAPRAVSLESHHMSPYDEKIGNTKMTNIVANGNSHMYDTSTLSVSGAANTATIPVTTTIATHPAIR